MSTYASIEDVANRWPEGQITDDNRQYVQTLIDDAERKLKRIVRDLDARVTSGRISADDVSMVVAGMVLRVLRSPGVYTQQAAGPFSATVNTRVASGLLEVLDSDLDDLGFQRQRAYTLQLRRFV